VVVTLTIVKRELTAFKSKIMCSAAPTRLWPTAFDTKKPLVEHVKALNAARKAAISSNDKFLSTPVSQLSDVELFT
jgi:hypothetical protein